MINTMQSVFSRMKFAMQRTKVTFIHKLSCLLCSIFLTSEGQNAHFLGKTFVSKICWLPDLASTLAVLCYVCGPEVLGSKLGCWGI